MSHLKKAINFIIEYFYPEVGGLEISTERLAIELIKQGYEVNIITKLLDNTLENENHNSLKIIRFPGDYIKRGQELRLYEKVNVNCVFGVGHDTRTDVWKPIFDSNVPTFIKIGTSGDMLKKGFNPKSFAGFKAILCQNDGLMSEVEQLNIENLHGEKIKNGLNLESWGISNKTKKECKKTLNINEDDFVVSAVARLVVRKNIPLIINGIRKFVKENNIKNLTLLIQGSDFGQHDGEEQKIKRLIEKYRDEFTIKLISPDKEVFITLNASDVFITMGEKEGAPNIVIEAMATGLPIIASNISGHDIYVTNNGYLIGFNEDEISKHIYSFYFNSSKAQKFGFNSLVNIREFDIKNTSKIYLNIFKKWGL